MILNSRETCIAYRCPYCGTGVKSMVGVFSLSGAVKKLKCDCGSSELTITQLRDGKLRISAPCFFCMTEHSFVIISCSDLSSASATASGVTMNIMSIAE